MVGGADADLIAGDLLIDIKTTTKKAMNPTELDQFFGYFCWLGTSGRRTRTFRHTARWPLLLPARPLVYVERIAVDRASRIFVY